MEIVHNRKAEFASPIPHMVAFAIHNAMQPPLSTAFVILLFPCPSAYLVDLSEGAVSDLALKLPELLGTGVDLDIGERPAAFGGARFAAAREQRLEVPEERHAEGGRS